MCTTSCEITPLRLSNTRRAKKRYLFIEAAAPPPCREGGSIFLEIFWTTYPITIILLVLERGSMNGCSEYLHSYHWAYEKFSRTIWKKSCDHFMCKIWLVLVSKYSIFFTAFFQKIFLFPPKIASTLIFSHKKSLFTSERHPRDMVWCLPSVLRTCGCF